jgi:TetR/AcrR family transcriptional regulator, transcriptional repressor of aconitase
MAPLPRLDSEERRNAIAEAAMPLFARKGFARTTTKEIAEAAKVSEALLFKHFPSKAALYEEILRRGCRTDPALERIVSLEPSTSTLIFMVHFMFVQFVTGAFGDPAVLDVRHRLMVNSFVEDGEFARLVFDMVFEQIYPKFQASLEAASRAGHLVPLPVSLENRFWFGQHIAAMMAYVRLPGRPTVPYRGDTNEVIADAVRFVLRGFGLRDEVAAELYNPAGLSMLLPQNPTVPPDVNGKAR